VTNGGESGRRVEPQVVFEFGPDFLKAFLAAHGVEGWNRWMRRMVNGWMPLGWSAGEPPPPVWYCFDFGKVDLPAETLGQLDLRACHVGEYDGDGVGAEAADGRETDVPVRAVLVLEWPPGM